MAESGPMPMCPMAEMCKGMMERPTSRFALIVPGIILIILGVTVLIEPRILAWLVAIAFIVMGIAMLVITKLVRRVGDNFHGNHG